MGEKIRSGMRFERLEFLLEEGYMPTQKTGRRVNLPVPDDCIANAGGHR